MRRRFLFLGIFLFVFRLFAHAEDVISGYTLRKIEEFVTYRVVLKSESVDFAYQTISKLRDEALADLPDHAIDFEQEERILESLYLTEYYERSLSSSGNQKELRSQMKAQMKKNIACIDRSGPKKISGWLYQLTGDVTSYYMTRSVTATFLYGRRVKTYYEKALEMDKTLSLPRVCLGNWCFYAPRIFGGGIKKALRHYESALETAELPGEKYLAYISMSQINYESKNPEKAREYLEMAAGLGLGRKDLDLIERCNEMGLSYFQYLRNRSGIDEQMSEDEKDEDDR